MKRFLFMTVAVAAMMLASCNKDDESGNGGEGLIGKWEAVAEYELVDGKWEKFYTYEPQESIIEFTSTHYTVYDKGDLGNGQTVKYTYDEVSGKIVVIKGLLELKVYKLTATELELGGEVLLGDEEMKTVHKRIK